MEPEAYFSSIQPAIHWFLVALIIVYSKYIPPPLRSGPIYNLIAIAPAVALYSIDRSIVSQHACIMLSALELSIFAAIKTAYFPLFMAAGFHINLLSLHGYTLLSLPSVSSAVAFIFHAFELYDVFAAQPLLLVIGSGFQYMFSFIRIASDCKLQLQHQLENTSVIGYMANKYASSVRMAELQFNRSKKLFVLRAILSQFRMRLVKAALGEALLGAASVWKIVSITRIFALASGQAEPSDVALILAVQYVLGLLLLTFKTYHVETKDELSTEIENALYRAVCKVMVMTPGFLDDHIKLSQAKTNAITPYVSALFQLVNCLSPISGVVGNAAILYSLFGWRIVFIMLIMVLLTSLSKWISSRRTMRLATQKLPQTLYSRLAQLVPSLLAFKMLAIEDVIFKYHPSDFFDDRISSVMAGLAMSVSMLAIGACDYLAANSLSNTQHALGAPVDILQALALIQQTATSCEDLVRSASILAELAQLENIIESKLAKNTFRSYDNGSRSSSKKLVIEITGAVFKRGIDDPFTLYVNQLSVESGKLVAVTGDVGAGKSTLLLAMLRELNMVSGESCLNGSVAYVGQSPWIMGSTIKENITFGKEVNDVLYRQAMSLCCLDDEVNQMSGGDSTVVSNQGSTLSGGQRARLALARALYWQKDIYLLDGVLSELDPVTQESIWKQVVSDTGFLKNKTRVIVTNDRKYVEQCHIVICVSEGQGQTVSKYSTVANAEVYYSNPELPTRDDPDSEMKTEEVASQSGSDSEMKTEDVASQSGSDSETKEEDVASQSGSDANQLSTTSISAPSTPFEALRHYIKVCGIWSLILASGIGLLTFVVPTFLYQHQITLFHRMTSENFPRDAVLRKHAWYSAVRAIADVLMHWIRFAVREWLYISFNRPNVVRTLMTTFAEAKMSEMWRIGDHRLLSIVRSSERNMLLGIHEFVGERTSYIASIVYSVYNTYLISFAMLPVLVAVSVSFVWLRKHSIEVLLAVQKYKVQTSEIKDKIVFNIFSGSLTVRVFDAYDVFGGRILTQDNQIATVHRLANAIVNTRMFYQAAIEQFLVLFLVGTMVVKSDHDATVDVRMYYEILTRSLPLLNYLLNIHLEARNYAFVLQEFCDKAKLVSEGARNTNATVVPETWIQEGRIEFSDITLRYNDEKKAALRKVALCIRPGEKIGIVGRTGSGKSSLINALLRIVELETGTIKIDGVDISQIGVHNLRKQISVVPQMAALFRGTLRANLDPSDKYSNEKVNVAIKAAGLEAWGPDKLIENNGINISAGEQKLIGICRAILQQRKIVILDEATANINNKAEEQLVRNVIASEFENSTVLTIAHRMETVRNSDRVLVMSRGRVAEFGTPAALVAQDGRFAKLVAAERSQQ